MVGNRGAFSVTLRRRRTYVQLLLPTVEKKMRLRSTDKSPRCSVDSSSSPARRDDGVREDPLESTARSTMDPGSPRLTFRSFISRRGTRAADVVRQVTRFFFSDLPAITTQRRRKPPLPSPPPFLSSPGCFPRFF